MHDTLIANWNTKVTDDDTIYHLGDLTFGRFDETKVIIDQLRGKKILVKGNHDQRSNTWYINLGFSEVFTFLKLDYNEYILLLTHKPTTSELFEQFKSDNTIGCFGHIHNEPILLNSSKFKCVSVERINYTPISIDRLLTSYFN